MARIEFQSSRLRTVKEIDDKKQIWLPELGLYYYKARIYSPTLGRFLQTDPIGYEDQYNLYAYVYNDPVNKIDPTGEAGTVARRAAIYGGKVILKALGDALIVLTDRERRRQRGDDRPKLGIPPPPPAPVVIKELGDLETIDAPGHNLPRPDLENLTDEELIEAINNPSDGQRVKVRGNRVLDGNGRIKEAKSRNFPSDTEIPVEELPEDDAFPELGERKKE